MFAQNLEGQAALNRMTVELMSSAETQERSVKRKNKKRKKNGVKLMCELQMFSNRDRVMGEYFSCIYF